MKLSVEAVAKMTGLSPSTVRQYAWERKIGKIEGRAKVFTLAEAKKLGGLKDGFRKTKPKAAPKKAKTAVKRTTPAKVSLAPANATPRPPAIEKRSFWSFLGIGRKPKEKVSLMEVRAK